jgi:hypothetical protein
MLLGQLQRSRYDLSLLPGRQSTREHTGMMVVMMLQGVLSSTCEERTLAIFSLEGAARASQTYVHIVTASAQHFLKLRSC